MSYFVSIRTKSHENRVKTGENATEMSFNRESRTIYQSGNTTTESSGSNSKTVWDAVGTEILL
jgi:hypothetical protein